MTVHCPERAPSPETREPDDGKGHGKARDKQAGKAASKSERLEAIAEARENLPSISHDISQGQAATRGFLHIRPSVANWKEFGWLEARRETLTAKMIFRQMTRWRQLSCGWEKLTQNWRMPKEELQNGLKELAFKHDVLEGKWSFSLSACDMDRVWPEIVWAFSGGEYGGCVQVEREDEGECRCSVFMENCFDPKQVESVKCSLKALLRKLVARVDILLEAESYSICEISEKNRWDIPVPLAKCMVQGSPQIQDVLQQDRERVSVLADAVESKSMDAVTPGIEDADAWDALLDSLHSVALQPDAAAFHIPNICRALPSKYLKDFKNQVLSMSHGLVQATDARVFGFSSHCYSYSEFVRMHSANVAFLGELCQHGVVGCAKLKPLLLRLLREDEDRVILPAHSTWAFVQQNLQRLAQTLAEKCPELGGLVRTRRISALSILTLNVWFEEHQRDLRTAILLSALRTLGPAVLCFQEVTRKVAVDIQQALPSWSSSDAGDGRSVGRYGLMILVPPHLKVRFSRHYLPTQMGRDLLVAELEGLTVGTVHLESLDNQAMREVQLAACEELSRQWPNMVLLGDFNLFSKESARCLKRQLPQFVDVWPILQQESGNTWRSHGRNRQKSRLDRVLAKFCSWRPTGLQLMFDEAQDQGSPIQPPVQTCLSCF